MPKKKVDILIITVSKPLLIGIYEENKLIKTVKSEEKSSDFLPSFFKSCMQQYEIKSLIYTNTPGSFMSIKVTYIFLKSLSILNGMELLATDAFNFNNNKPIKAIGKLFFVKINDKIEMQRVQMENCEQNFSLPEIIDKSKFSKNSAPKYIIGAV